MNNNISVVEQIDQAIAAHSLWKIRIKDATNGELDQSFISKAHDFHACAFGKWLDENKSTLASSSHYDSVYLMHQNVHKEIKNILDKVQKGDREAGLKAFDVESPLKEHSSNLILELMAWKKNLTN